MPDLATQLRTLIDTAADPVTLEEVRSRSTAERPAPPPGPSHHGRAVWWLTAAAALMLVAGTGLAVWAGREDSTVSTSGATVEVLHQVIEYRQEANTACPGADVSGEFSTMTFETWAEPVQGRWRQEVRYPDGSTRTIVAFGNPAIPTDVFDDGDWLGQTVRCGASGIVVTEPGQNYVFFLDYPGDAPPPPGLEPGQDFRNPGRFGDQVDGAHVDSLGRTSELWEHIVTGTDDAGPISQTESWWIDPATREVTERRFVNEVSGPGSYSWTATLTTSDTQFVDASIFETDGLRHDPVPDASQNRTEAWSLAVAPWMLVAPVDPSATLVPVNAFVGSCDQVQDVEVSETPDSVTIEVIARHPEDDRPCFANLRFDAVQATLAAPLGSRRLLGCGAIPGQPDVERDCRKLNGP